MSAVTPTTGEARPTESTGSTPRRQRGFMVRGVWIPALGTNDLASTGREWAAKPPPGMESEPFDWDEITKL